MLCKTHQCERYIFKIAQMSPYILATFWKKICHPDVSKIAMDAITKEMKYESFIEKEEIEREQKQK